LLEHSLSTSIHHLVERRKHIGRYRSCDRDHWIGRCCYLIGDGQLPSARLSGGDLLFGVLAVLISEQYSMVKADTWPTKAREQRATTASRFRLR
jgi:hypothetical protein